MSSYEFIFYVVTTGNEFELSNFSRATLVGVVFIGELIGNNDVNLNLALVYTKLLTVSLTLLYR